MAEGLTVAAVPVVEVLGAAAVAAAVKAAAVMEAEGNEEVVLKEAAATAAEQKVEVEAAREAGALVAVELEAAA
jgi:hypothetical protein